jgi:polyisoprenoid-binding protein YceI
MRIVLSLVFAAATFLCIAQDAAYSCANGKVHFFSKTPVEDIEATTQKAIFVVYASSKKVQAKIPMNTFEFKQKLMQEHFNENYVESDKYPYATFSGVIVEAIDLTKDGEYHVTIKGTFDLHGVKKEREIKGTITVKNGEPAMGSATFDVKLADHKIKIPKAVFLNIAEVIKIDLEFALARYVPKK